MWDLAPTYNALVVFAEHRYFGESKPSLKGVRNCLSYATTRQALEDYAVLLQSEWFTNTFDLAPSDSRTVVGFGGSYGGMLAAWFRFKYPHVIDGSIAGSAPIWGFPLISQNLDGAAQHIGNAVKLGEKGPQCYQNLLGMWPLLTALGQTTSGRAMLEQNFPTCQPLQSENDVAILIQYLQQPWFLMAEGEYPFPSNYIPYSMSINEPLPSWPVQVACEKLAHSLEESGATIVNTGNISDVRFDVALKAKDGKNVMEVSLDWNSITQSEININDNFSQNPEIISAIKGLSAAVGVYYNLTKDVHCYEPPLLEKKVPEKVSQKLSEEEDRDGNNICTAEIPAGNAFSWQFLVCNEGINIITTMAQGIGNDFYWPPTIGSRNYTFSEVINKNGIPGCDKGSREVLAKQGLYGLPAEPDVWAKWITKWYGGKRLTENGFSNVVFSNGYLDPWASAGVLSNQSDSLVASLITDGGHHADLMFPTEKDTASCKACREVEKTMIQKWISEKAKQAKFKR
eukprot:g1903.t1